MTKEIGKEGGIIEYGYELKCDDQNLVVKATIPDKDSGWIRIRSGNMSKKDTLRIEVDPNQGSTTGTTIQVNIFNTATTQTSSTCTQKYIYLTQAGEGGSGDCKYTIEKITSDFKCGSNVSIEWSKTEPAPTPPGPTPSCDGSIKIYYGQQQGSATIDCSLGQMALTAQATETCVIEGLGSSNPVPAAGTTSNITIATIKSGCNCSNGTWSFTHTLGDSIVDLSSIEVVGTNIKGKINPYTTGTYYREVIKATCTNGSYDDFTVYQEQGGGSTCDSITISYNGQTGSATINCNLEQMQLEATP